MSNAPRSRTSSVHLVETPLDDLREWRDRYLAELRCQVVHDSWHARGFTTLHTIHRDRETIGYVALSGDARDTVKEFFVAPAWRGDGLGILRAVIAASGARAVECQTNDLLLSKLIADVATDLRSDIVLFADRETTLLPPPAHAVARALSAAERTATFPHTTEPIGDWGIVVDGEVAATGGYFTHYNPPYGDVYMEVAPEYRRRGFGAYLVQEVKRACYAAGHVPAARCNAENIASSKTLQRAGFAPVGRIVRGRVRD
jgi:GNAT superfamily N-acetyltransferase